MIIFITDQQRAIQHFPEEWVRQNMPNLNTLKHHGMTFSNAICSASPCSPSRATLFTGTYPAVNGVPEVSQNLKPTNTNTTHILGHVLATAGYRVIYKGKWHINNDYVDVSQQTPRNEPPSGPTEEILREEQAQMQHLWGFDGWNGPDAGVSVTPDEDGYRTLGGGLASNDRRFAIGPDFVPGQHSAEQFLKAERENPSEQPFCLIVSLVNPHDIWLYTSGADITKLYPSSYLDYEGFELPRSYFEDNLTTKPWIQTNLLNSGKRLPPTGNSTTVDNGSGQTNALNFVKFYAYLQTLSDLYFQRLFATIVESEFYRDSIIIRLADHGELGMTHGGLQEKVCNVYRETINVPLIFHSPTLFREGKAFESQALVSLVDMLPTLAKIAQVPNWETYRFQGRDFSELLLAEKALPLEPGPAELPNDLADYVLFTFDDIEYGDPTYLPPRGPKHIRAILTPEWKYAVYYDLDTDFDTESSGQTDKPGAVITDVDPYVRGVTPKIPL
ncbi:MAG: sulfatase-like hydrolase/transferase [Candidatus Tectomicrobia bacterium]|nr:sulfatase-like hydrolase/transferase [Candidatus Tectomicrobia bacterium]